MQKFLVFILCVSASTLAKPQPKDIFDDADALLTEYGATVDKVIDTVTKQIVENIPKLTDIGNAVFFLTNHLIYQEYWDIVYKLTLLDTLAEEHGQNGTICTYFPKEELDDLTYTLEVEADDCIKEVVRENERLIRVALAEFDLVYLYDTERNYSRRIDECRAANDETCVLVVITQMGSQNAALPVSIDNVVEQISYLMNDVPLHCQSCATGPRYEYTLVARHHLEVARTCVERLIEE